MNNNVMKGKKSESTHNKNADYTPIRKNVSEYFLARNKSIF